MNVRSLVLRGAGAGVVAGLLAFVVARVFAEPLIAQAIDYESAREDALDALARAAGQAPEAAGPDIVGRGVQSTIGIGTGIVGIGIAFGLLVAITYALCHGRVGPSSPRALAMLLAGGGFATLYLVPFLKYPANPPSIGHEDTIGDRTALYLLMIVVSVALAVATVAVGRRLRSRFGPWNATVLAVTGFVVVIGVVMALLPSLGHLAANADQAVPSATETPQPLTDPTGRIVFPGFDADLLYRFRLTSVLVQALLWAVLGLVFGALVDRLDGGGGERRTAPAAERRPVDVA